MFPVNAAEGIDCAVELLNTTVADVLLAFILPDERLILPLSVSVFAPVVNVPEVSVNALDMVND